MSDWVVYGESSKRDPILYVADADSPVGAIEAVARRVWCNYHECSCEVATVDRQYFITPREYMVSRFDVDDPGWCWKVRAMRVEQGRNLWKS